MRTKLALIGLVASAALLVFLALRSQVKGGSQKRERASLICLGFPWCVSRLSALLACQLGWLRLTRAPSWRRRPRRLPCCQGFLPSQGVCCFHQAPHNSSCVLHPVSATKISSQPPQEDRSHARRVCHRSSDDAFSVSALQKVTLLSSRLEGRPIYTGYKAEVCIVRATYCCGPVASAIPSNLSLGCVRECSPFISSIVRRKTRLRVVCNCSFV